MSDAIIQQPHDFATLVIDTDDLNKGTNQNTWFVPKVSVLIFYLNIYWTHLKLQVISLKV